MAKNVLVTETLSEQMIKAGAKLVERLDAAHAGIKSAFWLFLSEEKTWRLILASPIVSSEGPRDFYKKVDLANQLSTAEEETISLNDVGVVSTDNQVVQLLRIAIGNDDSISGIRFSRNTINGIFIEDSYIYRSRS